MWLCLYITNEHANVSALQFTNRVQSFFPLRYIDMVMQTGSADCGLFALASATALANGEEPGSLVFKQKEMRPHLVKCLEAGEAESFPVRKSRRMLKKIKATYTVPIYCICRMPKKSGCKMIECARCKECYHVGICINVDSCTELCTKWTCPSCHL